ncbi:DUF2842 domain-containing protein [Croceicoccus mobilis]|uniref:DUF2842 domain-containing protein n=1 Tax=Croceicoccus mobilis TaxID=1703339 RepID=A0A916Z576_9SPHN|nr:DUF2842 domain-containing protein [Croceicoccus mobilis]GGD76786.1 hypothetical protein GCM10010990_28120 [Croceicoccus mobilis]
MSGPERPDGKRKDWQPTWRKPIGILLLLLAILIYAGICVTLVEPISNWHILLQVPVWLVLGVAWLLPLKRFLIWMETGRWK